MSGMINEHNLKIIEESGYKIDEALKIKDKLFAVVPGVSELSDLVVWQKHFAAKDIPFIVAKGKRNYSLWKEQYPYVDEIELNRIQFKKKLILNPDKKVRERAL